MSGKLYNVGVYIRLSRDSATYRGEESQSIENQQAMLSKFIGMMPGWIETRTYIDDGATGTNFKRRGFQDMITDVRQGIINLVLVKDLSRFGRNYLEAGKYLEEELPSLGCRFVALSDGIDTETGENDIMPFLSAINDFYVKNLSDRVKSVLTAKAKDGQKLSGSAPYGYSRHSEENTKLVIDEYAAGIVKRIYEARTRGIGYAAIAGILNTENILPPRLYYFKRQNRKTKAVCTDMWTERTIKLILHNELYIGHTVSFKRKTRSYRDKRAINCDKNDWIRVENTHTPIIGVNLWQAVQKINTEAANRYTDSREPRKSLFSGIVVCTDCQIKMATVVGSSRLANGAIAKYPGYCCMTYRRSGRTVCSWHKISEKVLKELVLGHIKKMAELITLDEDRIFSELKRRLIGEQKLSKARQNKECRELEQQLYTLERQLEQFYEDKVSGIIANEVFSFMIDKTETQRLEIESRLSAVSQTIEQTQAKLNDIKSWLELIKEKSAVNDVDRDLLESLIDKIEIGKKSAVNGEKTQDVRIFYKYVGLC